MIMQNTRESAIRRDVFHQVLQRWLDDSLEDHVGDVGTHAGPAWLWVRHGGRHFYLEAAATREGVREYLRMVTAAEKEVEWRPVPSTSPDAERVTVGPERTAIEGFDFYRHLPKR